MTPIDAILPDLAAALERRCEAVLVAPPGAGKTTRVPPALSNASWAKAGKLILLSPRRVAARAAAARMAAERGERVGESIGYRVRLDSKIGPTTKIEVVTEGVFTRMILEDPELQGVSAVLFDEFHERSLDADLGLALARDAQSGLRPDLRLLVMSATLDAERVAGLLGDAPIIQSAGRSFPVELRHRPRNRNLPLEREMAAAIRSALSVDDGDVLAFLPGAREIERTADALQESALGPNVDIRPLYGAMAPAAQDAAIAPASVGRRKIVLATSIAETSLTIEGVRIVVDSGLTRRPRFEPGIGLTRLETGRASQASAEQRRGRAGRTAPGVCWRLWHEGETRALPPFDRAEILEADLSSLALSLAIWGIASPDVLTWLDPPPPPAWNEARAQLQRIGALNDAGALTDHGRAVANLPLPPTLAHMVVTAEACDRRLAAALAVVLTEQGLGGRSIDLRERLETLGRETNPRATSARALVERIAKRAGGSGSGATPSQSNSIGNLLARALPLRVAKARGGGAFVMANGRAASLDRADPLAAAEFLVVAETAGAADNARIIAAAPISPGDTQAILAPYIETRTALKFDANAGAIRGRRKTSFAALTLSEEPLERISPDDLRSAWIETIGEQGLAFLPWDAAAHQLRARVALIREHENDHAWPNWNDATLLTSISDWLGPYLSNTRRLAEIELHQALTTSLTYAQQQRLQMFAPERFESPAGGTHMIDYAAIGGPALDVRLQELFGLSEHPSVCRGAMPLTLRLLSPAGRPIQITKDLPGFWRGSYASVRADMRGRYPKHPWPENPLEAAPTRRAKPRGS